MVTLARFVRMRLDEIEVTARLAAAETPPPWVATGADIVSAVDDPHWRGTCAANADGAEAAHIALHDPGRALAEVETWRRILLNYSTTGADVSVPAERRYGFQLALSFALKCKAMEWKDHPDYTPDEWPPPMLPER